MKKSGTKGFSLIKAVKANARQRVGTPAPERVLPDPKRRAASQPKHKQTFADLLSKPADE
ncbi:MAG: hypothetical protein KGK08_07385 [Acidobacteriota bacterium]|nr:hypothetical protein [Acidobacteriota bacterium]